MIAIQGLDYFIGGLSSVFVTIFLFAHSDLRTTILFQLVTYSSLIVFFTLTGWSLKRISSGFHMKLGVAAGAIFYFLLFILKAKAVQYIVPLAIFNGFGNGIYWSAFNFNQYIFTNIEKRERYFGFSIAVVNFLSAIAPFLGGLIITIAGRYLYGGVTTGYTTLFAIVFFMLAGMVFFIGKLPKHAFPVFSFRELFHRHQSRRWSLVLWQHALLGLYDVSLTTVMGILFYEVLKQEFWVGFAQAVSYLLGTAGGYMSAGLLEKEHRYFWIGSFGLMLSLTAFAVLKNIAGLWIFVFVSGFTAPFLNNRISSVWFQSMDTVSDHWITKFHLLLERDLALGLSRIASLLALYLYLFRGSQLMLAQHWLFVLPLLPFLLGVLLSFSGSQQVRS